MQGPKSLQVLELLGLPGELDYMSFVTGTGGVFKKHYQYLTTYKGLAFFATSPQPFLLPPRAEIVEAKSISIPDV